MADNLTLPAVSSVVATDEINGEHYQRVKLTIGPDGTSTGDLAFGQEAMAASLPVAIASNQSAVSVTPAALAVAIAATAVTVGVTETALPASALANRRTITVYNNGAVTIYVGPTGVTTSSGLPISAGQAFSIDLAAGLVLYGISGSANQNVRVLEAS